MYFVISLNENGEAGCIKLTKDTLLKRLNENYWGSLPALEFLPENWKHDMGGGPEGLLIIKGKIVVPKAVKTWEHDRSMMTVEEYEIE